MRVHPLKSLGAKLFYLMTILVLITVAGNSWQFLSTFRGYQLQQMQDTLQGQAERTKDQIENYLDSWRSQIAVALPTLRGSETKDPLVALQRFVDANPEFLFIQLFSAPNADSTDFKPLGEATTSHTADKSFEDKEPAKVVAESKGLAQIWLKKQIPQLKKSNVAVESLASNIKLPIMVIAARFDVAGSHEVAWAVLGTWQNSLLRALPKSITLNSSIIDAKGRIFSSLDSKEMFGRRLFGGKSLLKSALGSSSPSGFEAAYRDSRAQSHVGAYARLQRYPLSVVIEQNADAATQTINKTLVSTSLWACLFILFAIFLSFVASSNITKGLRVVTDATVRIAGGDLRYRIPAGTKDEVGALSRSVNHMSGKMIELMRSQVDKARFEKELETAKMVQSTFFPKKSIVRPHLNVSGFYTPASECGGDLWGHFTIAENVEFLFIADAMGHGAPSALVTAIAYSTTMTVADIIRTEPAYRDSPSALLERINRIIYEAVGGTICMTFFASIIDFNKGTLTFANAGHNFPMVLPLDKADPRMGKVSKALLKAGGVQPISLKVMGTPLGIDPASVFKEQVFELKPGDKLFYFTDGLIECLSPKGEQWGRKHLLNEVGQGGAMNPQQLCDDIVKKAFAFFGGVPLADDITVVVAEIGKSWQKSARTAPAVTDPVLVDMPLRQMLDDSVTAAAPIAVADMAPAPQAPAPRAPLSVGTKSAPTGKYKLKLPSAS